jgi:hypothetical protein
MKRIPCWQTGIVGSNPTRGMVVCVRLFHLCCVCVLCVLSGVTTGWSPVQGVLPTGKILKKRRRSKSAVLWDCLVVWVTPSNLFISVWSVSRQREICSSSLNLFFILVWVEKFAIKRRTFWTPDHWGWPRNCYNTRLGCFLSLSGAHIWMLGWLIDDLCLSKMCTWSLEQTVRVCQQWERLSANQP